MSLRIRQIRKAQKLSQQDLADKAGMSRSLLSEIETDTSPANTRRLQALADALGVTVSELFAEDAAAGYIREIEALTARMSEEDRQAILRMARALSPQQP